ncbi:MAG: dephospho-CoA kinase [Bacteroidales bacterium]|nr:dephospho-CoA kinase [Bacteroidales bacterium]
MKTVIVTGGIGSGKSAVCALLRERGIPVYDCDRRAKELYLEQPALLRALEEQLGLRLLTPGGKLDRATLAGRIFADPSARESVEALLYPALLRDFKRWRARYRKPPFVALESAIILSKPVFDGIADAVVLVEAPVELRLERVMRRDGADAEAVRRRMSAQPLPARADAVIVNGASPQALKTAVEQVFFDKKSYLCKILNQEVQA